MLQNFVQLLYFHSYEQINKEQYLKEMMIINKLFVKTRIVHTMDQHFWY